MSGNTLLLLSLVFFFSARTANIYQSIVPAFPAGSYNSISYSLTTSNNMTSFLITGWFKPSAWSLSLTKCNHLLDFTSDTLTAGQYHTRICIPYQDNTHTNLDYWVAFAPSGPDHPTQYVKSTSSQTQSPFQIIDVTTWNFFYLAVDMTNSKISFGIQSGNVPGYTAAVSFYEEKILTVTNLASPMQFTSVGRNLQFLLGGGYMDLTTYVLTPNAQFLSDVRFWIDTYPNVYLEFLEYMRTPVTSWYEILMTLTGAPNYLGIYGYLPSEPALYQIPFNTFGSAGTFPGVHTMRLVVPGQSFKYDFKSRLDFANNDLSIGYFIKVDNGSAPIFNFIDASFSSFYMATDNADRLIVNSGPNPGKVNEQTGYIFPRNGWVYIFITFSTNPSVPAQKTFVTVQAVTVSTRAQVIYAKLLPFNIRSGYMTFGNAFDAQTGWVSGLKSNIDIKDFKIFNGDMRDLNLHPNCFIQPRFMNQTLASGPYCSLCQSTSLLQYQLQCYNAGQTCKVNQDTDTDISMCLECPYPTSRITGGSIKCSTCGNSIREALETCDDGNIVSRDGCDSVCAIEKHSICYTSGLGDSCSCEPRPLSGEIARDWLSIQIPFETVPYIDSTITDPAQLCPVIFTNYQTLGTGPTCQVKGVNITVGFGSSATLMDGDYLFLTDHVIYYPDCTITSKFFKSVQVHGDTTFSPVTSVSAPDYVVICQAFFVSVLKIGNTALRPFDHEWKVTANPDQKKAHLNDVVSQLMGSPDPFNLTFPEETLNLNVTYTFSLVITNFLGNRVQSDVSIRVFLMPNVTFTMPGKDNLWKKDQITISLTVNPYYCGRIPYNVDDIKFSWSQNSLDLSPIKLENYMNSAATAVSFPSYTLDANVVYNFRVRALFIDRSFTPPKELLYSLMYIPIQISVTESALVAFISGGNKQVSFDSAIELDGTGSQDPDDSTNSGILYSWSCQFVDTRPCQKVTGDLLTIQPGAKTIIPPQSLVIGSTYVFTLTINKMKRSAMTSVKYKVVASNQPSTLLRLPSSLVGQKINPNSNFTIQSTVFSKSPTTLSYSWKVSQDSTGVYLPVDTSTLPLIGLNTGTLKIIGGALNPGVNYQFVLTVTDQFGSSSATMTIPMNAPPRNGYLDIYPQKGLGFTTPFFIRSLGWEDNDLPLQFKFSFWREFNQIGNNDLLVDACQWAYQSSMVKVLPNPESSDNNIYLYSVAQDFYGSVGISSKGVKIYITPLIFDKIDVVAEFHSEIFKNVAINNPNQVIEASGLVTQALGIYNSHTRLRNLQEEPEALQKEQAITEDLVNKFGQTTVTGMKTFESSTSVLTSLTGKISRLNSQSTNGIVDFVKTQLKSTLANGEGVTQTGTTNIADILDTVMEAHVITDGGRRILQAGSGHIVSKVSESIGHFFDSISSSQAQSESLILSKKNFNLMASTLNAKSIDKMNVKAGKTNSDPQFVLPTLNLSANTSGPVSINFITWNTNIYNDSDPIPINTNIVGLKIKTSADQSEIKIKDINQTIRIEIPIPDYNPAQISRSFSCIFYHEETQKWSDDGCAFTGIEKKGNNTYVGVCRCTHLTDFSISDQFGSLITNSGFQYFGSASDAFANGKIASLKVLYLLIALFITKLVFMAYGYHSDQNSSTILNSVFKRAEVMNIGFKEKTQEIRERTRSESTVTLEETEASSPEIKMFKNKPKTVVFEERRLDDTRASDAEISSSSTSSLHHITHVSHKKPVGRAKQKRSHNYVISTSAKKKVRFGSDNLSENDSKKEVSLGSAYCHALKKSHNFTSIFSKHNKALGRPLRFFLYFIRFYGMLAVSSLFFTQTHGNGLSFVSVILIMVMSFAMLGLVMIILTMLLKRKIFTKDQKSSKRARDELTRFEKRKRTCGIFFGIAYSGAAIFTILVVGLSIDTEIADAIFYTFLIQMVHDFFINQPLKVFVHLVLLKVLTKHTCKGCRKIMLKIIDANVASAFI